MTEKEIVFFVSLYFHDKIKKIGSPKANLFEPVLRF